MQGSTEISDVAADLTSGLLAPSTIFALAGSNTNPEGIADPPVPGSAWREVPAVVFQEDAAQMLFAAAWDTSMVLTAAISPLDTTAAALVPHQVPTSGRGVDKLMSQWEGVLELDRAATAALRATSSVARRAARAVDVGQLDTELETQLGWMADGLASDHLRE